MKQRAPQWILNAALIWLTVVGFATANAQQSIGTVGDFGAFIASGDLVTQGRDPYHTIHPLTPAVLSPYFTGFNYNLNPPISLLFFAPLASLPDVREALIHWRWISLVCYVAALALLARAHRSHATTTVVLWAIAASTLWETVKLGQIYTPLLLGIVGAWLLLRDGREIPAGLLIGFVAAWKVNLLVWPALLFLAGHRRTALASGASFVAFSVAPVLAFGPGVYEQWLGMLALDGTRQGFPTNVSLIGLAARFGAKPLGYAAAGTLLVGVAVWAWRYRPSVAWASMLGITVSLLASPIAWSHYLMFALPIFFTMRWSLPIRTAAALMLVPHVYPLQLADDGWLAMLTLGSMYNWAALLILIATIREPWDRQSRIVQPKIPERTLARTAA